MAWEKGSDKQRALFALTELQFVDNNAAVDFDDYMHYHRMGSKTTARWSARYDEAVAHFEKRTGMKLTHEMTYRVTYCKNTNSLEDTVVYTGTDVNKAYQTWEDFTDPNPMRCGNVNYTRGTGPCCGTKFEEIDQEGNVELLAEVDSGEIHTYDNY